MAVFRLSDVCAFFCADKVNFNKHIFTFCNKLLLRFLTKVNVLMSQDGWKSRNTLHNAVQSNDVTPVCVFFRVF